MLVHMPADIDPSDLYDIDAIERRLVGLPCPNYDATVVTDDEWDDLADRESAGAYDAWAA